MCYTVFMANTSEHISIRLPKHIVDQLRSDATRHDRSLSWIIGFRLAQLASNVDGILTAQQLASIPKTKEGRIRAVSSAVAERKVEAVNRPAYTPPRFRA